jgi:sugar lactone lactonase YvrE
LTVPKSVLVGGLGFPEGPRWHNGTWWFSDFHRREVMTVDQAGNVKVVAEVAAQPSGLGWLPDGRLVVVSRLDRRVVAVTERGGLETLADLCGVATGPCNDMVVDSQGRAYVGNFGVEGKRGRCVAALALVEPDGNVTTVADGLEFPNGMVISPDGGTLICAETFGHRLTAWDRDSDGRLSRRRLWADVGECGPDGITMDAEGAVWAADPFLGRVVRVAEGGKVLETIWTEGRGAYACMLGGDERTTLLICSNAPDAYHVPSMREGRLELVDVDVPGVGWP